MDSHRGGQSFCRDYASDGEAESHRRTPPPSRRVGRPSPGTPWTPSFSRHVPRASSPSYETTSFTQVDPFLPIQARMRAHNFEEEKENICPNYALSPAARLSFAQSEMPVSSLFPSTPLRLRRDNSTTTPQRRPPLISRSSPPSPQFRTPRRRNLPPLDEVPNTPSPHFDTHMETTPQSTPSSHQASPSALQWDSPFSNDQAPV